jgi:hypothetical protein
MQVILIFISPAIPHAFAILFFISLIILATFTISFPIILIIFFILFPFILFIFKIQVISSFPSCLFPVLFVGVAFFIFKVNYLPQYNDQKMYKCLILILNQNRFYQQVRITF